MRRINGKELKKLKGLLISLLCFITIANGAMKYLSEDRVAGDISVEHNIQEPLPAKEDQVATQSLEAEPTQPESKNQKVNINTADKTELQKLSGIGPTKSGDIIAYRDEFGGFKVIEEINEVKGIGDATYAKIKDFITVD